MKSIKFLIIVLTFFSCQPKLTKEEKYELETYKLINEGYFPSRHKSSNQDKIYDVYILEKPINLFETNNPKTYKYLRNIYKSKFSIFANDSLYFEKWHKNKITKKINYIFEDSLIERNNIENYFNRLTDIEKMKQIDSLDVIIKNLWNKRIINEYTELSLPLFNTGYTKAVLFYNNINNPNEVSGCIVKSYDLYIKKDAKWVIANYEEEEEELNKQF